MASKKKLLTSAIALGTAAALTLGGTFAWQSISQKALNEASDIVNPGGRLHNDLYYVDAMKTDANIYVENFADDDIYARVRLSEYMEIVMNYGTDVARVETVAGSKTSTDDPKGEQPTQKDTYDFTYEIHKFGDENKTDDYFEWTTGLTTEDSEDYYYMPTFNKNKDSLKADLHGLYVDRVGGISSRGTDQYTDDPWAEGDEREGFEIYDGDYNTLDELANLSVDDMEMLIEGGDKAFRDQEVLKAVKLVEAAGDDAHKATKVGETKGLLSVQEWLDKVNENGYAENGKLTEEGKTAMYGYWVYDTDGWVYWSAPIAGGETTGLLLDGFTLNEVMDDTWYYAIEAEAQFVTANDVGKADGTGFYTTADSGVATVDDGETETGTTVPVSENAETLLKLIGVEFDETTGGDNGSQEAENPVKIYADADPNWYSKGDSTMPTVTLTASGLYFNLDPYEYTPFDSEILANAQWELSGNTSEGTKLNDTTGEEVTLTIDTDETGELEVKVTISYNGYTNSGTTTISSEPHVASIDLFDTDVDDPVQHSLQMKYTAGTTKTYELAMFPKYTGSVYPYNTRFTGAAKEKLAEAVTFTLADADHNDGATVEGVTISQGTEDKTLLTVTIEEGVTEKFSVHCEASGIQGYANFKPADVTPPTVSVVKADSGDNDYTLTVSGITEDDYELPINFYELTSAEQDYSEGTNTYSGTLSHYGSSFYENIRELTSGACSIKLSNVSYDADTGTATMTVTVTGKDTTSTGYLGISVADDSDNVGKIATPLEFDNRPLLTLVKNTNGQASFVNMSAGDSIRILNGTTGEAPATLNSFLYGAGSGVSKYFTWSDGIFTLNSNLSENTRINTFGSVINLEPLSGSENLYGSIIVNDDDALTLQTTDDLKVGSIDGTSVQLYDGVTVNVRGEDNNSTPESVCLKCQYHTKEVLELGTDYTYNNGQIQIINDDYVGTGIQVGDGEDMTNWGYLFVTAAD